MIEIKRLSACTWDQAVQAWNSGFEGYYFDATMGVDAFTTRMVMEGLSPALSVVAFVDGEPAGIVLSGLRTIDGQKIAWNGGTGVAARFRRTGVGKAMIAAALDIYREQEVDIATLEAIADNMRAIELYKQYGYEITDHLAFYSQEGRFDRTPFHRADTEAYHVVRGLAQDARHLPFYQTHAPWQTQWQSARDGESVIVHTADGAPIAYAVYVRRYNAAGQPVTISLMQLGWDSRRDDLDLDDVIRFALQQVFRPELEINRVVVNLTDSHLYVKEALLEAGFAVKTEQVNMVRILSAKEEADEPYGTESIPSV
ncbi:MAG TPA: GNAT family N-acetyltransferase [Bacilli bacterium]|nr:GNAT family N-acetyltransferase [Bacilli bacterium]